MKKLLFSVAILVVAASCSKSEVTDVAPSTQNAIGFSTLNDRVTKVANTNALPSTTGATATNSNYTVYSAYDYVGATENAWYINGEAVEPANDGIVLATEYYWPTNKDNTLAFYAYAPVADGSMLVVNDASVTALGLTFTVPTDADIDFTIADPVEDAYCVSGDQSGADANGQVDLDFSHMLSKATIKVQLSDAVKAAYHMVFDDVKLTVDNNTVTADAVKGSTTDVSYSLMKGSSAGTPGTDEPVYTYVFEDSSTIYGDTFTGQQELMFAPQLSSNYSKIVVNGLTIKNRDNSKTIVESKNVSYKLPTAQVFAAGTEYLFTITLNVDDLGLIVISFDSTEAAWTPGTGVTI